MTIVDFIASFVLGLLTPLTAVCVLPLYPAFLAYLSNQFSQNDKNNRKHYALFGFIIILGVILFMFLLGLIFTTILQKSLTNVIGIVSPISFIILAVISIFLIFDIDMGRLIPKIKTPASKNPLLGALFYGFFFGAIVVPCNPAFIGAFFARAFLIQNFFSNILNFLLFGLGLGFPLLIFSLISQKWSQKIIYFVTKHKRKINLFAGIIMLIISVYYLFFVFDVFSLKI